MSQPVPGAAKLNADGSVTVIQSDSSAIKVPDIPMHLYIVWYTNTEGKPYHWALWLVPSQNIEDDTGFTLEATGPGLAFYSHPRAKMQGVGASRSFGGRQYIGEFEAGIAQIFTDKEFINNITANIKEHNKVELQNMGRMPSNCQHWCYQMIKQALKDGLIENIPVGTDPLEKINEIPLAAPGQTAGLLPVHIPPRNLGQ